MPDREKRPFDLTKLDAASLYEGLTLLSMMLATNERGHLFPYDARSITALSDRLIELWPELEPIYRPGRK